MPPNTANAANGEFCQFLVKNILVFLTWSFCFSVSLCMKCCIPGSMLAAMATERASLQFHGGRGRRFVLKTIISLQSCQWVLKEVRRAELAIFPVKFAAFWAWFVLARLCQTVWERPTYFPSPCMSRPLKKKGKELKAFLSRQTLRKGGKDSSSEKGRKGKKSRFFIREFSLYARNLRSEYWFRNIQW